MAVSVNVSYGLTLALAVPASLFLVRTFIIFHDCGHGSFFKSRRANTSVGYLTGVLTLTPFEQWTHDHAIHHATAGNLDRRGVGDVPTLTLKEFLALPNWKQWGYRALRHPLVLFGLGSIFVFVISHRFARPGAGSRERNSVVYTNLALLALYGGLLLLLGWKTVLLVQFPIAWLSGVLGEWLFYVQHQFDGVYWERKEKWDFFQAAVFGASYYQLPRLLQWFSGNIGFHHIHHLNPRIPNYLLEKCYKENPIFQQVKPLTLLASVRCLRWRLWDEDNRRLVGFDVLKRYRNQPAAR
jgi:omega-6 fatty acid desaturase (delta-12 desaturase)